MIILTSALWRVSLMLVLNRSLLNKEYILKNVLKTLASFKSKSKLCYDRRSVGQSCLWIKHPSGAYDQIFITVRQLRVCWCGASFWREDGYACITMVTKLFVQQGTSSLVDSVMLGNVFNKPLPINASQYPIGRIRNSSVDLATKLNIICHVGYYL
jgi:hypothetical protein